MDAACVLPASHDLPCLIDLQGGLSDSRAWLDAAVSDLTPLLHRAGAVLLRGLPLHSAEAFRAAVAVMTPELRGYAGGTSPRTQVADGVYTSTDYPRHLAIPLHNEMSYSRAWPERLYFFCATAPGAGGETPLADSRRILAHMPRDITAEFESRQLMYVRNLASAESRYNAWTKAFETTDRTQVERQCRERDIHFEWRPDGGLRIQEIRPAVRTHPRTGERVWFNQAHLFHASNTVTARKLPPELEAGLPMAVYYGDGGSIHDDALATVRAVLRAECRVFAWQTGDLLLVDNLLTAHGRMPFEGARQILVAMS